MPNLQTILRASRAHSDKGRKSANDNFYAAVQAAAAQQLQNQALRNAGMIGAVGLGTGAAARGLQGLMQLINRNVNKPRRSYPTSIPVDMPLHEEEEPKIAADKRAVYTGATIGAALGAAKAPTSHFGQGVARGALHGGAAELGAVGGGLGGAALGGAGGLSTYLLLSKLLNNQPTDGSALASLLGGAGVGGLAGAGAGGYAGYKGMQHALGTPPWNVEEHKEPKPKQAGLADFMKGEYAQSVSGVPWAMPAAVGAGAAGLAGGWSAMDYLLDKRRKGDLQAELEKAKAEYEAALMASTTGKTAAAGTLARDLDDLYDEMTKKANSWADLAGRGAGAYGIYGGVAGLTTALLAYNWDKKRQRRALIDKALKERRKRRFSSQPAAMYVRPQQNAPQVPQSMQPAPPVDEGLEF
jgi:hypothetical protein